MMTVATRLPVQEQAPDYNLGEQPPHRDILMKNPKSHPWDPMEPTMFSHQYGSELRNTHAPQGLSQSPSPKLQGSLHCYTRRVSEPVQPVDFLGHSYGRYPGPVSSRASSTLPSPSPMTPNTDDMIDQWARKRRPSDFATSAAPSSFSPKSPTDYDFPTGTHLPPLMNGSYEPTPRADIFPEGFQFHQAGSFLDHVQVTVDAKPSCLPMNGPPYPPHILDYNGDIFPEPYLDPHVLNMAIPEEAYTMPKDLEYGAELHDSVPHGIPHNALAPIQEDDYVNAHDHANVYAGQSPMGQLQPALPLPTGMQPSELSDHQGVHQPQAPQRSLDRSSLNQIRSRASVNHCPTCNEAHDSPTKLRKHIRKEHVRPYPCIFTYYGCNSIFGTKNEWSRHVKVQHLRLETWRCNIDGCEKYTTDEDRLLSPSASKGKCEYDRKDLFLNHVRRCHKDLYPQPGIIEGTRAMTYEDQVQQKCHLTLRAPPMQTLCQCCPGTTWTDFDARLEHIGRTMETNEEFRAGFHDPNLEMYMMHEGLLQWRESVGWLLTGAEGKKAGRQARRGSHQRPLTTHAPLTATSDKRETSVKPSRKSKRVELKKKKQQQQQLRGPRTEWPEKEEQINSDEDAEADDDEDY